VLDAQAFVAVTEADPSVPVSALRVVEGSLDAAAFAEALQREAPVLLAAARAITLDDAEADDLVQTTLELALRKAHTLRDPGALRKWLLTIQSREAFRLLRRLRRFVRFDHRVTEIPVGGPNADESLAVRAALRTLPPRMRAAVVLRHMVGLSVAEVAAALGTSENTVKTQLRLGLVRLREALDE
jgi:RNA polymerase sigma factor (sigma-70 family)